MFDLFKDIKQYEGVPPYASELYGVYQPLLGWQSRLTKKWLQRSGPLIDPRIKRILDDNIVPGPMEADNETGQVKPLQPGSLKKPYTVLLTKDLNSELLQVIRTKVQSFVEEHKGHLPEGDEWAAIVNHESMTKEQDGDLTEVNKRHFKRLKAEMGDATVEQLQQALLGIMQYESQIATLLLLYSQKQDGLEPTELNKLFSVRTATSLGEILRSEDPLAAIDPNDKSGSLSPVGFVHLFRQYFFDLGNFLGEPVEHIWLAPGTTIELVEVSTRKTIIERTLESTTETASRSEQSMRTEDELSDAVKEENQNSTKLGVSSTNSVNLFVYQGTVTASFELASTRTSARETAHKQNREQSEKLSSEIKKSFRSVFRTVTETTDMRSRRYVVQNTSDRLLNYELRRKMRRVGVQVQDIGTRLCWQVVIDDAGAAIGLAELVHIDDLTDVTQLKEPEKTPRPTTISKKVVVPLMFKPVLDYSNNRAQYEFQGPAFGTSGDLLGIIKGDEDDDDSQIIIEFRGYKFDPPQTGYKLIDDIRLLGVQGNKLAVIKDRPTLNSDGSFDIIMQRLNFGGENVINLEMELFFAPTSEEIQRVDRENNERKGQFDEEKRQALKKAYLENVRKRIKDASTIHSRPSWDMREEERTIIYRRLIERLMLDSWKAPDTDQQRRVNHVRSEIIRAIFDIDSMLYFVAPEWWMPRNHQSQLNMNMNTGEIRVALTDDDVIRWGNQKEKRADNYKITEDSAPAKLGSSLGWLLQLDGDNLRNAFLNAPWVKAVIPIRPGREEAALNWLRVIEGHENDGWDAPYLGATKEDAEFRGKTVGEVLEIIAKRMTIQNSDVKNVLEADKVFEHGFDHLANGFNAGLPANQVFSQWVSVLPTDQIAAVEYKPTDLLKKDASKDVRG